MSMPSPSAKLPPELANLLMDYLRFTLTISSFIDGTYPSEETLQLSPIHPSLVPRAAELWHEADIHVEKNSAFTFRQALNLLHTHVSTLSTSIAEFNAAHPEGALP